MQFLENPSNYYYQNSNPDPSVDFPQRESHYLFQISKLNELLNDLRGQLNQQESTCNQLLAENLGLKGRIEQQDKDLDMYKETLKRLYVVYVEQQKLVEAHKYNAEDFLDGIEKKTTQNLELNKEKNQLLVERDGLFAQLNEGEFKYYNETSILQNELAVKNEENLRLVTKNDELMDIKTRLEEELNSLRFSLEKLRIESHNLLREKTLELEQQDRSFQESLDLKSREILSLLERVRLLESDNIRLLNENQAILHELAFFRSNPPAIIRQPIFEGPIPPMPPPLQMQGPPVHNTLQKPPMHHVNERGPPPPNLPSEIREVTEDREDFRLKLEGLLDLAERNWAKKLRNALFEIWRLKSELGRRQKPVPVERSSPLRQKKVQELVGFEEIDLSPPQKHMKIEFSDDIFTGLMGLVLFLQEKVNSIIFELFVRSINHANQRKLNSLILFILNLKELRDKYWKGLELALETYQKVRKIVKSQFPELRRLKRDEFISKLSIAIGILEKRDREFRDNINQWFEGTLSTIHTKFEQERKEQNRDVLFLFRLLTVKYRVRYPLRGKSFTIDADLDNYLENKIIKALRRCLKDE